MIEQKSKKKFDFEQKWTKRKLKNIDVSSIREELIEILKKKLSDSQLNLVIKTQELIASRLCDKYSYTEDDFFFIREGLKTYSSTVPAQKRKIIEQYEEINNIKTIWRDKVSSNLRNQHFKIQINE